MSAHAAMACRALRAGGLMLLAIALASCAATRGRRGNPETSGFLGDYSQLEQNPEYEAALVYVDPNARWSHYNAIQIDSVTLWSSDPNPKIKDEDRQMLTDLLFKALHDELGEVFVISQHPGPNVVRLRAAITNASGANVPLRTITSFLPPALVLSTAGGLSADVAGTVGQATVEVEALDSVTQHRLAAAVDARAGTKHPLTTRTFSKWGDVQAAAERWADKIRGFFEQQGMQPKK